ncbi:uncharacterized protein [Battus philenor]|uniref:uncharacterized protein n=1 Tax=Battus philenor TaxID=42288 RepID=UPI0035D0B707
MTKKITSTVLFAMLTVYAVANHESLRALEKGGDIEGDQDYNDKSDEIEASGSIENESVGCLDNRNTHGGYERDGSWKRNRHVGYSATASAAASADASANTYEHGHKDAVYL